MRLPDILIEPVVRMALAEDLGRAGDVTALACIPEGARMKAAFTARKPGVLAGIDAVRVAVLALDPAASVDVRARDGDAFEAGAVLAVVEADARAFLSAERTALNLVGRLSGVAALTRTYVQAVAGTKARIADTRKTTPGLRALEKHAVACGGGMNHRFGLDDAILIKDNHVAVCGGVAEAVRRARAFAPHLMKVEVEVDGLDQLDAVLAMDPQASVDVRMQDGDAFKAGAVLAVVEADARAFLSAERTALNLVGRLSGVATLTRTYVEAVAGTKARIADTRKTTPGLRALEKHAVACGGGMNHRFGLDDAILIKDNHVAVCVGVVEAVRRARAFAPHLMKVEVEVDGLDQLEAVLALIPEGVGPDVVMLDNFSLTDLRTAVARAGGKVVLEASGGVDLTTVRAIAATGVDVISVGALTHSAPVLDIGLDAL